MRKGFITQFILLTLILVGLGAILGCDSAVRGGAEIWLENVNLGSISQNGKTIQGIPTGNISAVLKVATNKVYINSNDKGGFVIKLSPSNAIITTSTDGISITGVDPEKIELKFQSTKTTK